MLVIAEPYFRFLQTLGPTRLESGAAELLQDVEPLIVAQYLGSFERLPIRVSVRVERGSTKAWITVTGLAGALIFYGDIRQSIDYLVGDAKRVADLVRPFVAPNLGLGRAEPAYRERRLGAPGSLHRLFAQVERREISPEEATQRAVDLLYTQGGPETVREAPGLLERLSREFRAARSRPRRGRERELREVPDLPLLALPPEPIPSRRRSGVVAARDPLSGALNISTY